MTLNHFNYPTGSGLIGAKEAVDRVTDISIQGKVFEDFGRDGIQDQGDRTLEGFPSFLTATATAFVTRAPQPKFSQSLFFRRRLTPEKHHDGQQSK